MSKLKLRLDALRVESFATEVAPRARGTVQGQSIVDGAEAVAVPVTNDVKMCLDSWINTCVTARISDCPGETCGNQATCLATCDTCITICGFSCPTGENPVCCPPA